MGKTFRKNEENNEDQSVSYKQRDQQRKLQELETLAQLMTLTQSVISGPDMLSRWG